MSDLIHTLEATDLAHPALHHAEHVTHLESGQIIYLPHLSFHLDVPELCHPEICDTKKKNIAYDHQKEKLRGISTQNPYQAQLQTMMHAYADYAKTLVDTLLPTYQTALRWGRTSYRPAEISGRHRSKRQDDTRIHVDAFPATPVQGWRILRVFCNINPNGKPRVWDLGEPFAQVLQQFAAQLSAYQPFKARLLQWFKITKTFRTGYDHYMLALHDQMKLHDTYQANLKKTRFDFPAYSTWVVFTDQVSHAALGGQYLLEQTFYLPVSGMQNPNTSPWQHMVQKGLI
ncbi:MAG: Kdo hydroxylase family protein [Legionellales bacterium]|nr:Kdo hydroxylase family protein [Legionellales bacterium]